MFTRLENQINYSANYNAGKSHNLKSQISENKTNSPTFYCNNGMENQTVENRNSGSTFLRNPVGQRS